MSNAGIARTLAVSEVTVTAHVSKILQKLVRCVQIHAVVIPHEHGILSLN